MGIKDLGKRKALQGMADHANRLRATGSGINMLENATFSASEVGGAKGWVMELDDAIQFDVGNGSAGRSITAISVESATSPAGLMYTIDVTAENYSFDEVGGRLTITELEIYIDE